MQSKVKFNTLPEKVPEKVLEILQSQIKFNRVLEKVPEQEAVVQSQIQQERWFRRKFPEALEQSQVSFNRVPKKFPEKV